VGGAAARDAERRSERHGVATLGLGEDPV
jgi:hypothetical protein